MVDLDLDRVPSMLGWRFPRESCSCHGFLLFGIEWSAAAEHIVMGMTHPYEALKVDALIGYLTGAAVERGERLDIRREEDRWRASLVADDVLIGEAGTMSAGASDRRTALIALTDAVSRRA
jgi:hypothetical protein